MTDRDHFAAAALTGLLSDEANQWPTALQWEHLLKHAYRWADAMLRARERTDLDAVPAARATEPESSVPLGSGVAPANTTSPHGSSAALIKRKAERQSPAHECGGGEPLDECVQTMGSAPGGRGHFDTPEAIGRERQRSAAPSAASRGSQPFAWAADIPGKFGGAPTVLFGYTEKLVRGIAAAGGDWVQPFPLYRSPTLTDEEREAVKLAAEWFALVPLGDTLSSLLERTK